MTLYEIDAAMEEAINKMLDSVDEETGEVNEEDAKALADLQAAKEEKLDNLGAYIKNLEAEADAIDAEIDRLEQRLGQKKRKIQRLKDYVTDNMIATGMDKFESSRVRFSFRKSEQVSIEDERNIPKEYMVETVTQKPDKKALKDALKSGIEFDGVHLITKQNLQIK